MYVAFASVLKTCPAPTSPVTHLFLFTVASDFSGTAHSFAGSSLAAAWIDCLPWDTKPDKAAQLSGYMSMSRLSHTDDMYFTQPFSPELFSQGDLPGPSLLLQYQIGKFKSGAALKAAWDAARPKKGKKEGDWATKMP